jgi:hypothetical protein
LIEEKESSAMNRVSAALPAAMLVVVSAARGDVVTDWNAIMERTVAQVDPFVQVRSAAITQVAVFEAVNSIIGDYEPYLGRIAGARDASPDAAAVSAAYVALVALHPDHEQALAVARDVSLAEIPDGAAKRNGIAIGERAARAIVSMRAGDGSDAIVPYTPGTRPGDWQPTPPDFAPAFRPGLGAVVPFVIEAARQFRAPPPPALRSTDYTKNYDNVKDVGDVNSERPHGRAEVALYFEATDAVALWNPVARQVSAERGTTLSENARILALMTMAICDAAIAVFESKYYYNYWRPVTAIQAGGTDHNRDTERDPDWMPFVYTPPFPGYPSGHAAFGGAARRVLENAFGPDGHDITLTNRAVPDIVLHYSTFEQITRDVDDGRVYGGVHYRFDQEQGGQQGRRIGRYVLQHALRPR